MCRRKKEYSVPAIVSLSVQYVGVIAASASIGTGDGELDPDEAWSDKWRDSWGNIWQETDVTQSKNFLKNE